MPDPAFIVRVNLKRLALNLSDTFKCEHDELSAMRWIVQSVVMHDIHSKARWTPEPSPFYQTDEFGVFYSEENPAFLLMEDEIEEIAEVEKNGQWIKTMAKIKRL